MGFIKWLWNQYRAYKNEQYFPKPSKEEKDNAFMRAYYRCVDTGLTTDQVNALVTLFCAGRD